ncbi:hypothetical protein H0H81_006690 [Sphagnurus paluster]|uniref:Chitin synthase n=1 Tax=Sphagnurus paluster TaxID=117069 RepID=A0A9P7K5J6_9AGAR|nr:hypothetical protein H0H81_006690 [Sphagnurus paluster]
MYCSSHIHSASFVLSSSQKPTPIGPSSVPSMESTPQSLKRFFTTRVLKYVKGAIGETDVPESLPEFISQRRRWLNGSFFAATYAIAHVGQILRSGHSVTRKVVLLGETLYNIINLIFSWFSIVSVVLLLCGCGAERETLAGELLFILCAYWVASFY